MPYINKNNYYKSLFGAKLQATNDASGSWTDIYIMSTVDESWNNYLVPVNTEEGDDFPIHRFRHYRLHIDG